MFSFVTGVIAKSGIWGVFLLMLLENVAPILPSELILPLAGFQAAQGQFYPVAAIILATLGSALGGLAWYAVGRWIGLERLRTLADGHGRWLPVTGEEVARANAWFQRCGPFAVCIGRAAPGVRGVICIPAGVARMPLVRFLIWSSLGAFAWSDLLISSGYALRADYRIVAQWVNPVSDGLVILCVALYLLRVLTYRKRKSAGETML
jgi:membrane protein DedA with SNARE-associated domain